MGNESMIGLEGVVDSKGESLLEPAELKFISDLNAALNHLGDKSNSSLGGLEGNQFNGIKNLENNNPGDSVDTVFLKTLGLVGPDGKLNLKQLATHQNENTQESVNLGGNDLLSREAQKMLYNIATKVNAIYLEEYTTPEGKASLNDKVLMKNMPKEDILKYLDSVTSVWGTSKFTGNTIDKGTEVMQLKPNETFGEFRQRAADELKNMKSNESNNGSYVINVGGKDYFLPTKTGYSDEGTPSSISRMEKNDILGIPDLSVEFNVSSSILTDEAKTILDKKATDLALYLTSNPTSGFDFVGYVSNDDGKVGGDNFDKTPYEVGKGTDLAMNRAQSTLNYLADKNPIIKKAVTDGKIVVKSGGETDKFSTNKEENRRLVLEIRK